MRVVNITWICDFCGKLKTAHASLGIPEGWIYYIKEEFCCWGCLHSEHPTVKGDG